MKLFIVLLLCFSPYVLSAQDSLVTIYFSGDVTLANHFESYVGSNYDYAFKKIPWFADADISMVNLENPLTDRGNPVDKAFTFQARPDYVKVLQAGGVDIVTLANNHIFDFDTTGVYDTVQNLQRAGIYYVGAGRNLDEARHPVIFYIKGLRIAIWGYYGLGRHSDSHPASADSAGTAMRSLALIRQDILKYKDEADVKIINFHWGLEKAHYPQKSQVYFAHQVIDAGADVIIGHHPHVLQGVEQYHKKFIFYSLGNFIFGGNSRTSEKTVVLRLDIAKQDTLQIVPKFIPVQVDHWQPYQLRGKQGNAVLDSIKKYSIPFKQINNRGKSDVRFK